MVGREQLLMDPRLNHITAEFHKPPPNSRRWPSYASSGNASTEQKKVVQVGILLLGSNMSANNSPR